MVRKPEGHGTMTEQHDDHIWLTVYGEAWAIRRIQRGRTLVIHLWRGYAPNLEFQAVEFQKVDWAGYCEAAVAMLRGERLGTPPYCAGGRQ